MNKYLHVFLLGISYKLGLTRPINLPYQFTIEPTNICNFRCVFCPQSNPEHRFLRKQGYLTVDNIGRFINEVKRVRPGNRNISLTLDGEPAMNKALPDFVKLINDRGFLPRFSSNGKLLTPALTDKLVSAGSFLASVDFASKPEYFDNVRGREGDYDIVLVNLRYMVDIARYNPGIKMELVNISHFSGADPVKSLNDMKRLFPDNLPANIAFWSREFHNFGGHLKTTSGSNYKLCPYPWTSFTVTWEGDVVPCCRDTLARTVLGNVFSHSIHEIWHGERYQNLRKKLVQRKVDEIAACEKCDLPWSGGQRRWNPRYVLSSLMRR
ncbi:MAG: SPASM domain-containing protein [Nitrospirae bacterium]|nr:SPASM domain-containing protein [Nitrospirota bacterium]